MQKYCFVTIDTEEDEWGSIGVLNPSVENIAKLVRFQEKCNEYAIIPTYLINYPVATHGSSRKVLETLLKSGRCEIGMHCHPWNTPPILEDQTKYNSFLCNLSEELVVEKLERLHEAIKANLGVCPDVFRAGRWGMGRNVLSCLEKLKYKVDTSITPFHSWKEKNGPDFQCRETRCFFLNHITFDVPIFDKNTGSILEIPPTMGYLQKNELLCHGIKKGISSFPLKLLKLNGIADFSGVIKYRWLSPEVSSAEDMIKLSVRQFAKGVNFINMFFHSNSLLSGATPFVKNERERQEFYDKIEIFFKYVVKNDIKPISLSTGVDVSLVKC